jgi:hypothetical protein
MQKYVHTKCLERWQVQLAAQKGLLACQMCDVCKTRWKKPYRPKHGRLQNVLRSTAMAVAAARPLAALALDAWKAIAMARGVLSAMEAGSAGFRLGVRYHELALGGSPAPRRGALSLLQWLPMSMLATSLHPVQLSAFLVCYGLASTHSALMGLAGAYAGSVCGFTEGIMQTAIGTLHAMTGVAGNGMRLVSGGLHWLRRLRFS